MAEELNPITLLTLQEPFEKQVDVFVQVKSRIDEWRAGGMDLWTEPDRSDFELLRSLVVIDNVRNEGNIRISAQRQDRYRL